MGRWAQARKRGRGGPQATLPFPAPAPEEWNLSSGGLSVIVGMEVPCPDPVVEVILIEYRLTGDTEWIPGDESDTCGDTAAAVSSGIPGESYDVRIAWADADHNRLSEWSELKTVVCTL